MYDLVVHGATVLWVRVTNHDHPEWLSFDRYFDDCFQIADGPWN